MRIVFPVLLGLWVLFSFAGCSGMLDSLRAESAAIDREADRDRDPNSNYNGDRNYQPRTLRGLSANNVNSYDPPVKRGYGRRLASITNDDSYGSGAPDAAAPQYHRATRADFVDSTPGENSLWDGQGQENFLFAQNKQVQPGDLVTVDVEKELKREIQYQLWMTLPPEQRRRRKPASTAEGDKAATPAEKEAKAAEAGKSADEKNRDAAEEAAKTNLASAGKEDDIVRMEVAENLGNGIVRVVGQKRVIYRGVARVVEVTALVNNRDLDGKGRVKSSSFLDMKTQVIQ
jgi:flagellar basal body L-ring protein FlgH